MQSDRDWQCSWENLQRDFIIANVINRQRILYSWVRTRKQYLIMKQRRSKFRWSWSVKQLCVTWASIVQEYAIFACQLNQTSHEPWGAILVFSVIKRHKLIHPLQSYKNVIITLETHYGTPWWLKSPRTVGEYRTPITHYPYPLQLHTCHYYTENTRGKAGVDKLSEPVLLLNSVPFINFNEFRVLVLLCLFPC